MNGVKILLYLLIASFAANGQSENATALKYRRSSLYTLMLTTDNRKYEDVITKTFIDHPIPEKFNDHCLPNRKIGIHATADSQKIKDIDRYITENKIASQLVAKWFNRDASGCFNMELVAQRGMYDASEMSAATAKRSQRGLAILADAGEELIGNTFVLISDFRYINKEDLNKVFEERKAQVEKELARAREIKRAVNIRLPGGIDPLRPVEKVDDFINDSKPVKDALAKGYFVVTTSYLYRLSWNDSVANAFYTNFWMDQKSYSEKRKKDFDEANFFTVEYIGSEVAYADLQSTIFTTKSEAELVHIATVRALDAVIAKLQKKHEEFRTSTPLIGTDPISAGIGLKEGLEAGDTYQVLQQVIDEDGKTRYEEMGVVKADKSHIWDNRYMAGGDSLNTTFFKKVKGKTFYPGMLLRQKSTSKFLGIKL